MKVPDIRTKRYHGTPHVTREKYVITEVIVLPKLCKGNRAKCKLVNLGKGYIVLSFYYSFNFSLNLIYIKTYSYFFKYGSRVHPRIIKSDSLGVGPRHPCICLYFCCLSSPGDSNVLPGLRTPTGLRGLLLHSDILWTSAPQGEWHGLQSRPQTAAAAPGNLLEMEILGPHPDLVNQTLQVRAICILTSLQVGHYAH